MRRYRDQLTRFRVIPLALILSLLQVGCATSVTRMDADEVKDLRSEARQLKEALAEVTLENRLLKKSVLGDGENDA